MRERLDTPRKCFWRVVFLPRSDDGVRPAYRFTLKSLNGIAFSEFRGYETFEMCGADPNQ